MSHKRQHEFNSMVKEALAEISDVSHSEQSVPNE